MLIALALTAACSGGDDDVVASDSERDTDVSDAEQGPESDFCSVLIDGTSELDEQTAAAGDSTTDQLLLLIENYSDLSRLLRRLTEVAPAEINSDVAAVAEAWARQADTAAEAANNPAGALVGSLMSTLLTGASYDAVDDYAEEHCGRPLFRATFDPADDTFNDDPDVVGPYSSEEISFTTESGWSYVLSADLPALTIEFDKDIQTSPPGKAKLTVQTSSATVPSATIVGNTPGRTPPTMTVSQIHYIIPLVGVRDTAGGYHLPGVADGAYYSVDPTGGCSEVDAWGAYVARAFELADDALYGFTCAANEGGTSSDQDEFFIDALVPVLNERSAEPVVYVSLGQGYSCGILFYPNGTYTVGPDLASGVCGP